MRGPGGSMGLIAHTSLSPIRRGFAPGFATASDKVSVACPWLVVHLRVLRLPPPLTLVSMI